MVNLDSNLRGALRFDARRRPFWEFHERIIVVPPARDPLPDQEQKQAALSYLNEAWAEARHDGVDGDCLAQASLFAAFAELVGTYGEDAVAKFVEGLLGPRAQWRVFADTGTAVRFLTPPRGVGASAKRRAGELAITVARFPYLRCELLLASTSPLREGEAFKPSASPETSPSRPATA